jgi:hypothetical protein
MGASFSVAVRKSSRPRGAPTQVKSGIQRDCNLSALDVESAFAQERHHVADANKIEITR